MIYANDPKNNLVNLINFNRKKYITLLFIVIHALLLRAVCYGSEEQLGNEEGIPLINMHQQQSISTSDTPNGGSSTFEGNILIPETSTDPNDNGRRNSPRNLGHTSIPFSTPRESSSESESAEESDNETPRDETPKSIPLLNLKNPKPKPAKPALVPALKFPTNDQNGPSSVPRSVRIVISPKSKSTPSPKNTDENSNISDRNRTVNMLVPQKTPRTPSSLSQIDIKMPQTPRSQSACRLYPLSPDTLEECEFETTWDGVDDFAQRIDQIFFSQDPLDVTGVGGVGAVLGAMASSPACGYLMFYTADFLKIPVSGAFSYFTIGWVMATTTPAFMTILYHKGKVIGTHIFKKPGFTSTGEKDDFKPHVVKKNNLHLTLGTAAFISSAITAAFPTALMHIAEKDFPVFFSITVAPFYLTWLASYFDITSWNLDQFFQRHFYMGQETKKKKEILQQKIGHFKEAIQIETYNEVVTESFNCIQQGREKRFSTEDDDPFVFSCLFLKSVNRADAEIDPSAPLLNFRMDMGSLPSSWSEDILKWLGVYTVGAGTYPWFSIIRYILKDILSSFGIGEETADIASTALSAFATAFNVIVMSSTQQQFFKGLPQLFSLGHLNNFIPFRKTSGIVSGINAVLFTLPFIVKGLEVYQDSSLLAQIAYLTPVFLNGVSFYDQLFNKHSNNFITNVVTMWEQRIESLPRKRAVLAGYADRALQHLDEFDAPTIDTLYSILQDGV